MNYIKDTFGRNQKMLLCIHCSAVSCIYARPIEGATQRPICRMMYDRNKTSLPHRAMVATSISQ